MKRSTLNSPTYTDNNRCEYTPPMENTNLACGYPADEFSDMPNINDSIISEDDELFEFLFNFDSIQQCSSYQVKGLEIHDKNEYLTDNCENSKKVEKKKAHHTKTQLSKSMIRALKRKVGLSPQADEFKKLYYQIFTSKKKFPKELVKQIHDIILIPCFLKKMSREEYRRIDLYFQEYSKYSERILIYLQKHKRELLESIPELSDLK